jgi:hypothetical protein
VSILQWTLLSSTVLVVAVAIILLVLLIWVLLRKRVVVPQLTVKTDKTSYLHGETVNISGNLSENGVAVDGEAVSVQVKDPDGNAVGAPIGLTTDASGNFATTWAVPSDAAPGVWTVSAAALGIEVTASFTRTHATVSLNPVNLSTSYYKIKILAKPFIELSWKSHERSSRLRQLGHWSSFTVRLAVHTRLQNWSDGH